MTWTATCGFLTALTSVGATQAGSTAGPDAGVPILPRMVSVQIVGATIGPGKIGGKKWDGMGKVPPNIITKVAEIIIAGTPAAPVEVVGLLASPALAGMDFPDPYGWAEVAINGQYDPRLRHDFSPPHDRAPDTYTPIFLEAEWKGIPLNHDTRIKVTLWDKDIRVDDSIGIAEINYRDLVAALQAEKIYQVMVADQTQNQLLFIGISVRAVRKGQN